MIRPFLMAVLALTATAGYAADSRPASAAGTFISQPSGKLPGVVAVTSVGPGQAGYVHYFVITHPDDSLEYQVGIELEDQRIAWSVPNAGVIVSNFIKKGTLNANGTVFKVEHLHGLRPFATEAEMRTLQKALTARVAQWIDNDTPYCLFRKPGEPFCLSCGDFVIRVLYPGFTPLFPALPADFAGNGKAHTTDDLLMYLIGIYNLPDKHAQLARLSQLNLPAGMREDIVLMIEGDGAPSGSSTTMIAAPAAPTTPSPSASIAKPQAAKPAASKVAIRRASGKKL